MKVITYHIKLLEPTLITSLNGDPNSAVTFDYLPGSVLRGMLINRYRQAHKVTAAQFDKALVDPDSPLRRRFFSQDSRYLNGYLVDRQNHRSLPVPRSWQQEKKELLAQTAAQPAAVYDFALAAQSNGDKEWKGAQKQFCSLVSPTAPARLLSPKKQVAVHTARERSAGRPRQGGVYRYISLSPEQTFAAAILCDDQDSKDLSDLLKGQVKLGGSRTGGYGLVHLEVKKVEDAANWSETRLAQPFQTDRIVLSLLSNALLRNARGQYVPDAQELLRLIDDDLILSQAFMAGQIVGGFNQKWGLPLPQTAVLSMGSVFVCRYQGSDSQGLEQKLQELKATGVGERRYDGFGRIAVNWHTTLPILRVEGENELDEDELPEPRSIQSAPGTAIAQTMTRRLLQQRLEQWNMEQANRLGSRIQKPSNSQLSRLRQIIQDALRQKPKEGRERLDNYFLSLEKRQKTRQQFGADRIDGRPLLDWLRFRVNDEKKIKEEVGESPLPAIGTVEAAWTDELVYRSNLLLVDTVLARALKLKEKEA